MIQNHFYTIKETVNTLLLGLTIPSLAIGKVVMVIPLLLLLTLNYREILTLIKKTKFIPILKQPLTILLLITVFACALTIPYSLNTDKSIISLSRTVAIFPLVFIIVYSVISYSNAFLKLFPRIMLFTLMGFLLIPSVTDKIIINALTLGLPILLITFCKKELMLAALNFCIILYLILANSSKASLLAILILILTYSLFFLIKKKQKKLTLSFVFTLLSLLFLIFGWLNSVQYETSLIKTTLSFAPTYLVDLHRQIIWQGSLLLAELSPWVGHGLNASNYHQLALMPVNQVFQDTPIPHPAYNHVSLIPGHPHNWILEFLIDVGLIGLIPMLTLVFAIFITIIRKLYKIKHLALLALLAIQGIYWGTGLFNFSFWTTGWQVSYFLYSSIAFSIYLHDRKASCYALTP